MWLFSSLYHFSSAKSVHPVSPSRAGRVPAASQKAGAFGETAAFSGLSYLINSFITGLFEKAIPSVWWSKSCLCAKQCLSNSLHPFHLVASCFSRSNWKVARLTMRSENVQAPFLTFQTVLPSLTLRAVLHLSFCSYF